MRLSLCMIVRDNQSIIAGCLSSISPWVDEMIVVDTGSVDGTSEIAASMGASVSRFKWIDDFSAARNASLPKARGEWIFWMDSDDVIDADNGRRLRQLTDSTHAGDILGYVMQVHCPGPQGALAGDVTVVDHIKLFRNRPDLRFEGRIHEQILPAIRRAEGEVAWTDIFVTHKHGSVTPESKSRKYERDLRILQLDLAERGEHPFVLFNLGMTYSDMGRFEEAAQFLRRSINAAGPSESHLRKAYALLAACYLQTSAIELANRVCEEGRQKFPDDPEIIFRSALVSQQSGRLGDAEQAYKALLRSKPTQEERKHFSSCDVGIAGHKARHNLAAVLSEQGRWGEAEYQWRLALEEAPGFQPALIALSTALVKQNRIVTASHQAQQWLQSDDQKCAGLLLLAKVAQAKGCKDEAIEHLESASNAYPDRMEPVEELAQAYFESGRMSEAARVLARLAELRPRDPVVAHNLASAYLATNRLAQAQASAQRSLALRPQFASTEALLSQIVAAQKLHPDR